MSLQSHLMNLSDRERSWLPWFGSTGKLKMRWSTFLNRHNYKVTEQTFEGIAATRVKLLQQWSDSQWQLLKSLSEQIEVDHKDNVSSLLIDKLAHQADFIVADNKDLAGDVRCLIGEKIDRERGNFLGRHLLDFGNAFTLRIRALRNGADQAGPGKRRDTVGTNAKAGHIKRDRARQADDPEFRGSIVRLTEVPDQTGG